MQHIKRYFNIKRKDTTKSLFPVLCCETIHLPSWNFWIILSAVKSPTVLSDTFNPFFHMKSWKNSSVFATQETAVISMLVTSHES